MLKNIQFDFFRAVITILLVAKSVITTSEAESDDPKRTDPVNEFKKEDIPLSEEIEERTEGDDRADNANTPCAVNCSEEVTYTTTSSTGELQNLPEKIQELQEIGRSATTENPYALEHIEGWDLKCKFQSYFRQCGDGHTELSYSYDLQLQACVRSEYGNCKYGYNNFESMKECKEKCADVAHHPHPSSLPPEVYCRFQPDFGDCTKYYPSFYYDINTDTCIGFSFSGCAGNYNRFHRAVDCKYRCLNIVKHIPKNKAQQTNDTMAHLLKH